MCDILRVIFYVWYFMCDILCVIFYVWYFMCDIFSWWYFACDIFCVIFCGSTNKFINFAPQEKCLCIEPLLKNFWEMITLSIAQWLKKSLKPPPR